MSSLGRFIIFFTRPPKALLERQPWIPNPLYSHSAYTPTETVGLRMFGTIESRNLEFRPATATAATSPRALRKIEVLRNPRQ